MRPRRRQSGITLTEVTIVVASMAILMGIALPATKMFFRSFESQSGAMTLISGALSAARAMAIKHQRYAGVRFQCEYDPRGPLYARQYMIHIVHDRDGTDLASGFRAIEGLKPMPLPEPVGVTDLIVRRNTSISSDALTAADVNDMMAFSIVFSPSGRVVVHDVRMVYGTGELFISDEPTTATNGYLQEPSRTGFLIFDRKEFNQAYERGAAWTQYLSRLKLAPGMVYVSPYTGRIISTD